MNAWTEHAYRIVGDHGGVIDRDSAEQLVLTLEDEGGHDDTLRRWLHDGAWSEMKRLGKRTKTVVSRAAGKSATIPAVIGTSAKSRGKKVYQQSFWLHVPVDAYRSAIKKWRKAHDAAGENLRVHEDIAELIGEHPEAKTPAEACETAGIDVYVVERPDGLAL